MDIRFKILTQSELSELDKEASEVPFLMDGVPLLFRMARGLVLGIGFGDFYAAPAPPGSLVLAGSFSPFRLAVFRALLGVERGKVLSYSALATAMGRPTSTRAVASAVASNPFAYIVPCHRIVRSDGSTGRYRWGDRLKAQLLRQELSGRFEGA